MIPMSFRGLVLLAEHDAEENVSRAVLLPFVTTVDSGVAEVVRKQEQGWSYIKSGF